MKKIIRTHNTASSPRFRYWIRKGYAAFSSLGKCVTIGCLRKNVTEQALMKQPVLHAIESEEIRTRGKTDDEIETDPLMDLQLLPTLICPPQITKVCCSCAANSLEFATQLRIYNPLKRGNSPATGELPLFLYPIFI